MSFASVAALSQLARLITVEASSDNFATTLYRWSDTAFQDTTAGLTYDGRILSLGEIARSLGVDRVATSAAASLELDNTDAALDALMTGDSFAGLRFRVNIIVWDTNATSPTFESKRLGEFTMQSPAQEKAGRITLQLGDDMMTRIGAGLMLPTLRDWARSGSITTNPIYSQTPDNNLVGISNAVSWDTPVQLAYGEDWLQALPHILPTIEWQAAQLPVGLDPVAYGDYYKEVIVPLYATLDLGPVSQALVSKLRFEWLGIDNQGYGAVNSSQWADLPTGSGFIDTNTGVEQWFWKVEKSATIVKNGKSFQIVYLRVDTGLGDGALARLQPTSEQSASDFSNSQAALQQFSSLGGYFGQALLAAGTSYAIYAARVIRWFVMAGPKSQITNPPATIGDPSHAVDIATDLVTQYLTGTFDSTTADRVKAGNPNAAATGVVHPWTERQNYEPVPGVPNTLRQVMTKLAQSSDIDFFINWSGQLAFSSDVWAWLAAGGTAAIDALAAYDETDIAGLDRWIPTEGDRWAPFNRVYLQDAKEYPPEKLGVPFQGAFDLSGQPDIIPASTRVLEVTLLQGWRPYRQQKDTPLNYRQVDGTPRWKVRFKTHLLFLQHDLGDYFRLTWRRDSSQPALYDGTVFQVEGLTFSATDNSVTVEAIWRDDARTTRQYLLDDERYFDIAFTGFSLQLEDGTELQLENGEALVLEAPYGAYVYSSGGRTWVTTPDIETFSALAVGDLFVTLYNASTPSPAWVIGVWRIDQIDTSGAAPGGNSAIRLVAHPDGTLPATSLPQTIPGTDWMIQHSPLTLANLANHPNGVRIYGCSTNSSGQLSDNSIGNKLLNG